MSIYDDTLFVWDMNDCTTAARPRPQRISVVPGLRNFDANPSDARTLAVCGSFGPSLYDTRAAGLCVPAARPSLLAPDAVLAGIVRWHPSNEHVMACAHDDGVVRLWDVRKNETFGEVRGHRGKQVTTMAWNHGDLFTGASDGNIVHWDLTSDVAADLAAAGEAVLQCTLKEGMDSVAFDPTSNTMVDRLHERQCGTLLPALNNRIVGMCQIGAADAAADCNILSIDTLAFLGLHCQLYGAPEEKHYYSPEDLLLINSENSTSTLVDSADWAKPLAIKHRDAPDQTTAAAKQKAGTMRPEITLAPRDAAKDTRDLGARSVSPGHRSDVGGGSLMDLLAADDSRLSVPSLHSVDSLPGFSGSFLDSGSVYSVSTLETFVGAPEDGKALLAFLDTELERICAEFQNLTLTT